MLTNLLPLFTLQMQMQLSDEILVSSNLTSCHNPEHSNLSLHRHKNFISHTVFSKGERQLCCSTYLKQQVIIRRLGIHAGQTIQLRLNAINPVTKQHVADISEFLARASESFLHPLYPNFIGLQLTFQLCNISSENVIP